MISDWFDQMNEVETKWIDFVTTSFKSCFSEQIPIENFYHIKNHFIQSKSKSKRKIEIETKWMIKAKLSLFLMFSKKMNNEININIFKIIIFWIFSFDLMFASSFSNNFFSEWFWIYWWKNWLCWEFCLCFDFSISLQKSIF